MVAAFLADRAQRGLKTWRLLVGEAARPDRVDQFGEWRVLDGVPVGRDAVRQALAAPARTGVVRPDLADARVLVAERLERDLGIRIGAVLGQDRRGSARTSGRAGAATRAFRSVLRGRRGRSHQSGPTALETLGPRSTRDPRTAACAAGAMPGFGVGSLAAPCRPDASRSRSPSRDRCSTSRASRSPHRSSGHCSGGHRLLDGDRTLDHGNGDGTDRGKRRDPFLFEAATDRDARHACVVRSTGDPESRLSERRLGIDPALTGDHQVRPGKARVEIGRLHHELDAGSKGERSKARTDRQQCEPDASRSSRARRFANDGRDLTFQCAGERE